MPLKLYNTLTRKKEVFKPSASRRRKAITFYACGPTVYDFVHIGNLRTFIFNDLLRRTLNFNGFTVRQIMNITGVDDKTIRGAKSSGKNLKEYTSYYERAFFKDIKSLNILPASKYPRATGEIKTIVALINILLKKGIAYRTADGVYFDISKLKSYGKLSRLKRGQLKTTERISQDEYEKDNAQDFALWKFKKEDEPSWKAPFGEGRPGWHIECSAMSIKYLGLPIDIHTGGVDLIFPHHENEIAQSEAAFGRKFVRFFLEGEMINIEGHKMSKSLKNIFTLRDMKEKGFDPLDFRYLCLTAQYRSPLSFTWESLSAARTARLKLEDRMRDLPRQAGAKKDIKSFAKFKKDFMGAINDDLNTPKALALLWKFSSYKDVLLFADKIFGLGLDKIKKPQIPAEVRSLITQREELRREKKWRKADKIREKILDLGFIIEDTPSGPKLKRS